MHALLLAVARDDSCPHDISSRRGRCSHKKGNCFDPRATTLSRPRRCSSPGARVPPNRIIGGVKGQGEFGTVRRLERRCTGRCGPGSGLPARKYAGFAGRPRRLPRFAIQAAQRRSPFQTELVAAGTLPKPPLSGVLRLLTIGAALPLRLPPLPFSTGTARGEGLHRQANALLLGIDRLDFDVDRVPFLEDVADAHTRWCASSEICTKPSTPGSNCTKAPNSMIFETVPRWRGADREFAGNGGPRILGEIAQGEADLVRLGIDLADEHFHGLTELQDVARVLYPLPGKLADVQQAVDAPQINERTERLQAAARRLRELALRPAR